MSLSAVRTYFRTRMKSLGYKEWTDGFASDNIPNTIVDRCFHMVTETPINTITQNHTTLDLLFPMTIHFFVKGFRDPASAIDKSLELGQGIVCDIIRPSNANGVTIKSVQFLDMIPIQLAESNDNDVILEMNFNVRLLMDIR